MRFLQQVWPELELRHGRHGGGPTGAHVGADGDLRIPVPLCVLLRSTLQQPVGNPGMRSSVRSYKDA